MTRAGHGRTNETTKATRLTKQAPSFVFIVSFVVKT
jgi:hypothetical protein